MTYYEMLNFCENNKTTKTRHDFIFDSLSIPSRYSDYISNITRDEINELKNDPMFYLDSNNYNNIFIYKTIRFYQIMEEKKWMKK